MKRGNFSLIQVNEVEPLPTPAPHIPKRSVIPNSETTLYIPFQTQSLSRCSHRLPLTDSPPHPHHPRSQNLFLAKDSASGELQQLSEGREIKAKCPSQPLNFRGCPQSCRDTIQVHLTAALPETSVLQLCQPALVPD